MMMVAGAMGHLPPVTRIRISSIGMSEMAECVSWSWEIQYVSLPWRVCRHLLLSLCAQIQFTQCWKVSMKFMAIYHFLKHSIMQVKVGIKLTIISKSGLVKGGMQRSHDKNVVTSRPVPPFWFWAFECIRTDKYIEDTTSHTQVMSIRLRDSRESNIHRSANQTSNYMRVERFSFIAVLDYLLDIYLLSKSR